MDLPSMGLIVEILLAISLSLLVWTLGAYSLLMSVIARGRTLSSYQPADVADVDLPTMTVVLPVFNEERDIERRVTNLCHQRYAPGKLQLIIVESGSTDSTRQIARGLVEANSGHAPEIRLVLEEERVGKARAVGKGLSESSGEIVVVSDANTEFNGDALRSLAATFSDDSVGAATGRYISKPCNVGISKNEREYWRIEESVLLGESIIHSPCYAHGSISAFRRNLAHPQHDAVADDLEMWLEVLRRGKRGRYVPAATAYEKGVSHVSDSVKQRKRTSLGTILAASRYRVYLMKPSDAYRLLIFPSHRLLPLITPFLLTLVLLSTLFLGDPIVLSVVVLAFLLTVILNLITMRLCEPMRSNLLNPSSEKSSPGESNMVRLLARIFNLVSFFVLNQYILILAWIDFVRGSRDVRWEKAESTRR